MAWDASFRGDSPNRALSGGRPRHTKQNNFFQSLDASIRENTLPAPYPGGRSEKKISLNMKRNLFELISGWMGFWLGSRRIKKTMVQSMPVCWELNVHKQNKISKLRCLLPTDVMCSSLWYEATLQPLTSSF